MFLAFGCIRSREASLVLGCIGLRELARNIPLRQRSCGGCRLYRLSLERTKLMALRNPPHPGGIVRRQCLDPLDLSVTEAAKGLGVTRQALSDLVNGKAGISIDMAIRLSKAFGSSPETWLGMQMAYDLWQAREHVPLLKVRCFRTA